MFDFERKLSRRSADFFSPLRYYTGALSNGEKKSTLKGGTWKVTAHGHYPAIPRVEEFVGGCNGLSATTVVRRLKTSRRTDILGALFAEIRIEAFRFAYWHEKPF